MIRKSLMLLLAVTAAILIASCDSSKKDETPVIGKPEIKINSDRMTPEVLWSFGRVTEPAISPDNQAILFGITYYDIAQNKGNRELYSMPVAGGEITRLTTTPKGENNAIWRPDGKKIGFVYIDDNDVPQIWEMNPDGSGRIRISAVPEGVTGFSYAPDQQKILYTSEVKLDSTAQDINKDLPLSTGKIFSDLMYRHWDSWVETYSHIFIADYDGKQINNPIDIMKDEKWESPIRPFGGMEQITWSPDSKSVVYASRKKQGKEYAVSTNSDLYQYQLETGKTTNLTVGMNGYDLNPVFSPDGSKLAWECMERDGYESDKIRLFVMDVASKEKTDYSANFDQNAERLAWGDDNTIWFISDYQATDDIYKLLLSTKEITGLTKGIHNFTGVFPAGDKLIATQVSMSKPAEIYAVDPATGAESQLTFVNKETLDQLALGEVRQRWVKTTDNKQMHVWMIYPPHFDSTKKYPALLYCEGGPQSTVSQFWSYRWNFQMMAANDYIIVAPNRRGLPGFGREWNEQISGDYGGQNMKDYLTAIDALSKEPYIDANRLGAVGASYGGFSVFWLAGNHQKRFKAFIAHDGMFNLEAQYLETEEMWFVNWDLGGPFWDKTNAIAQRTYSTSPHKYVQNWDTPILVIHGANDYRIAFTQGMSAFNAAILRGVPAEFLYFPDENHWVLKPQNGILWQRTFYRWLDRWLK
ncbi:MAG: S9 family peptidase [Bacteroidetes bacterium]|nr:S9 family peptidase [Bacteroidota bacterium]